jgi:hypothetical protein
MTGKPTLTLIRYCFVSVFFVLGYLYFLMLCPAHLAYQEQMQLFRLDLLYFQEFLKQPGGLSLYAGSFLTQFFINPALAALIVTTIGIAIWFLSVQILKRFDITGPLPGLFPPLLVFALQSHQEFLMGHVIAFIVPLAFSLVFIHLRSTTTQIILSAIGLPALYLISGGWVLLAALVCLLYELLNARNVQIALFILAVSLVAPVLSSRFLFVIPPAQPILTPLPKDPGFNQILNLSSLIAFFPLAVSGSFILNFKRNQKQWSQNKPIVATGLLIAAISGAAIYLYKTSYDYKTELLLRVDQAFVNHQDDRVLELADQYPGSNQFITYYTNLSLARQGRLTDQLFNYNQIGTKGLYLPWQYNSPLFGSEVFYELNYTNEAYRWAFEAMETTRINPRSLKRLILTSLINTQYEVAKKYLNLLTHSLFYRDWARHYRELADHPELIETDPELATKRRFAINTDFWADDDNFEAILELLLQNHPENRVAFEYLMAYQMLEKDASGFIGNLPRLAQLGYTRLPRHIEEGLLAYSSLVKDEFPKGYNIRTETRQRLSGYAQIFRSNSQSMQHAASLLFKDYGNTYWFYLHFFSLPHKN